MGQVSKDSTSGAWGISRGDHACFSSNDASFFSTSLPVLPHEKLLQNFNGSENCGQSLGAIKVPNIDKLEDDELNIVGNVLPDDEDELLAAITDDFNLSGLRSQLNDLEECDLFGPGGGMELDFEQESLRMSRSELNISDGITANGMGHFVHPNSVGAVVGEHPYGEHPSRTLFVRNINSNVEDYELRSIFEQYGDIRTLYTACKHRGFVMISYYDIRDARTAMRALQNKPLRRRKLDIHFSIPKDNPSEKDSNQGTLVVFNLDASVSNDDLRQIFGAYGEVKEIRETPHKRHHKFIEFYDVRAAEAALIALNKSDIAGKRIKLEPSRPGGARRSLVQQLSQELEHDETQSFRHQVGSPMGYSPPGTWGQFGSPVERSPLLSFSKSPVLATINSVNGNSLAGLASIIPLRVSNPSKNAPIGKDQRIAIPDNAAFQHSHSFYDQKLSTSPVPISAFRESNSNSSGIGTLSAPQFLWGSPTPHSSSSPGATSLGHAFTSTVHTTHHGSLLGSYHHHHVGSAPSGVPFNGHFGSPETSLVTPVAYGSMGLTQSTASYMNMAPRAAVSSAIGHPGWMTEKGSPSFQMMSLPRKNPVFPGNGYHSVPGTYSWFAEQSPNRRVENIQQFHLDLDKIISGEDARTSLMIKNIPNKYTAKMLMATIDENHSGTYDFLYLLIDFKNRCNLGYAFINMVSPSHIIPFYKEFNGKKWEKFNSEKVASLAYARLQGKAALAAHFQNSSLMNEDKQCRPILFKSQGQEIDDQEHFLSRNVNIVIRQPDGSYSGDSLDSPKGSPDE